MTSRTHTRCWYCGAADVERTREHILSEKNFGGRLVSPDAVCKSCNGLAGKIEAMVAGHPWVAEAVAQYMTGPGGKAFPQSRAVLPDGAKAQVERRPSGVEVLSFTPRQLGTDDDGTEVWEVGEGTEDEFVERRRKKGQKVRAVGRPLGPGGYMELHYGVGVANFAIWPRFVAKVALGAMSLYASEDWLDSDGALALQDIFHERRRPGAASYELPLHPWEQDRSKFPWSLYSRGEHVVGLWLDEDTGKSHLWLTLFGYLVAEAEIRDFDCSEEPVWLVPCDGRPPTGFTRTSFNDWLDEQAPTPE
jgi:hypothetical protein